MLITFGCWVFILSMKNEQRWSGCRDGAGWDVELGAGMEQDALLGAGMQQDALLGAGMEQEVGLGVLGGSAGCSG